MNGKEWRRFKDGCLISNQRINSWLDELRNGFFESNQEFNTISSGDTTVCFFYCPSSIEFIVATSTGVSKLVFYKDELELLKNYTFEYLREAKMTDQSQIKYVVTDCIETILANPLTDNFDKYIEEINKEIQRLHRIRQEAIEEESKYYPTFIFKGDGYHNIALFICKAETLTEAEKKLKQWAELKELNFNSFSRILPDTNNIIFTWDGDF